MKLLFEILILAGIISSLFLYLRVTERRLVFYPSKEFAFTPRELGLFYEDITFATSDKINIHAWIIPADDASYTILFCHGNAGNISHRLGKIKFFHDLGCNVFIFDYRGYGKNQGRPSEAGMYADTQAAYDYLLSRDFRPDKIVLYGESLGGAAAIDLAVREEVGALIVESTFSNAKDMSKIVYPYLPYWMFSIRLDSLEKIKLLGIPKLFIHSVDDEIVPYRLGRKLYESSPGPKKFLEIHGAHNDGFFESEEILCSGMKKFLDNLSLKNESNR